MVQPHTIPNRWRGATGRAACRCSLGKSALARSRYPAGAGVFALLIAHRQPAARVRLPQSWSGLLLMQATPPRRAQPRCGLDPLMGLTAVNYAAVRRTRYRRSVVARRVEKVNCLSNVMSLLHAFHRSCDGMCKPGPCCAEDWRPGSALSGETPTTRRRMECFRTIRPCRQPLKAGCGP